MPTGNVSEQHKRFAEVLRDAVGKGQESAIATAIGQSPQSANHYLTGRRLPDLATLTRILTLYRETISSQRAERIRRAWAAAKDPDVAAVYEQALGSLERQIDVGRAALTWQQVTDLSPSERRLIGQIREVEARDGGEAPGWLARTLAIFVGGFSDDKADPGGWIVTAINRAWNLDGFVGEASHGNVQLGALRTLIGAFAAVAKMMHIASDGGALASTDTVREMQLRWAHERSPQPTEVPGSDEPPSF